MRPAPPLLVATSLALAFGASVSAPSPASSTPPAASLVVKASPVAHRCVAAAAASFGAPVRVDVAEIGTVESARDADVVVAAAEELTRVVEGGASVPDVEAEVGRIPWVLEAPAGSALPDMSALARSSAPVRVPRGVIARHARASLEAVPAERVRSVRPEPAAVAPAAGEVSLVPLSLAGRGNLAPTQVPPVVVDAVAVRASPRPEAARSFVEFLAAGAGHAAFRSCGREASR